MPPCPDESAIIDFVEARLSDEHRAEVEQHLDDCDECRRLVAETAAALLPTGEATPSASPFQSNTPTLPPGGTIGRYQVLRRVGAGAMGVVYAAEDSELRRQVALKLIRAEDGYDIADLRRRLLREARAAAAVRHPNVVPIHDVLELDDGTPVLVMDLLEGETLRERLEREERLSVDEAVGFMLTVLSALEAAHAMGVVHRDLKPDNVFLERCDDGRTTVRIVDFGVAKLTAADGPAARSAGVTRTGMLIGTPQYMAPEQAFGEGEVDGRADLWAVGAMLYECLSGSRPVAGETVGQVLKNLARLSIPPLQQLVPGVPPAVAQLVHELLIEQADRPSSAAEVARKLQAALEAAPDDATADPLDLGVPPPASSSATSTTNAGLRQGWLADEPEAPSKRRTQLILVLIATLGVIALVVTLADDSGSSAAAPGAGGASGAEPPVAATAADGAEQPPSTTSSAAPSDLADPPEPSVAPGTTSATSPPSPPSRVATQPGAGPTRTPPSPSAPASQSGKPPAADGPAKLLTEPPY